MPPTLYDHTGQPVRTELLKSEHAAPSVTGIRSILTTHPAGRLTPQRLANILREAEVPGDGSSEDYVELAEEMEERDLHYLGVLNTRKRQVVQIGVMVEPASDSADDLRDAELVQSFFAREAVEDELTDILDAVGKGYSVTEIDWETSESQWMPRRLVWRLPQWFDFDRYTGEQVLLRKDDGWEPLAAYNYVVHIAKVKSGIPIRGGLARAAAWSWLFKSFTLKDWMRFVEAYGHPIRLGKYPPNADPDDKAVLYRAVRNVAADAAAILPEGMDISFVDDTTVRVRAEVFERLIAYLDSRISIAVLGQTLTTEQGDRGSQALGNVHNRVREDIERSDARHRRGAAARPGNPARVAQPRHTEGVPGSSSSARPRPTPRCWPMRSTSWCRWGSASAPTRCGASCTSTRPTPTTRSSSRRCRRPSWWRPRCGAVTSSPGRPHRTGAPPSTRWSTRSRPASGSPWRRPSSSRSLRARPPTRRDCCAISRRSTRI